MNMAVNNVKQCRLNRLGSYDQVNGIASYSTVLMAKRTLTLSRRTAGESSLSGIPTSPMSSRKASFSA